ncbi:MAG: type II toxin-antitoxin system VapC family toxin [Planctomycetes bacterium]|nr:type II toxin-antitoxin system VapC family toxin [Planctomycetota bacterium]
MPIQLLVDTDIIVDYLRGHEGAAAYLENTAGHLSVSAVTVAELFVGTNSDRDIESLEGLLSLFVEIPVDRRIARQAGLFRREYKDSHGIGIADALIAATARIYQLELATFNVRHFPMFRHLKAPYSRK